MGENNPFFLFGLAGYEKEYFLFLGLPLFLLILNEFKNDKMMDYTLRDVIYIIFGYLDSSDACHGYFFITEVLELNLRDLS